MNFILMLQVQFIEMREDYIMLFREDKYIIGIYHRVLFSFGIKQKELKLDGVFIEIGAVPNSDIVKGLVELDQFGQVIVNHKTQETSVPGIWAVGDVTDVLYKQNNISVGDAVKAALAAYNYLLKREKKSPAAG